jgi:predicted component of viral defense system (DUF524 family)
MSPESVLELTPRSRKDENQPVYRDGARVLRAETDWLLTGPPEAIARAESALGGVCERLGAGLLLLSFGNAVGQFRIPGLGTVHVESGKIGQREFDALLADVMSVASALPFQAGGAGTLPYDPTIVGQEDVLYHAFVYLRHVLSDAAAEEDRLHRALELVTSDPHRRFDRRREAVPIERAHRVDEASLVRLMSGMEDLVRATGPAANLELTAKLRGYLPRAMTQVFVISTLDTPENRFVKAFLAMAAAIVTDMRAAVEQSHMPKAFARRLIDECDDLSCLLENARRHSMWSEVGEMIHVPAGSTVLQRRRGYRDVFRHFARMRLAARVPLPRELVWDLLETRDIAQLYELWCFFELATQIEALIGPPAEAGIVQSDPFGVSVRRGVGIEWADGTWLTYNSTFSRSAPANRRSYSLELRPDISLLVPRLPNKGLHLLDAKFKVDAIVAQVGEDSQPDQQLEEQERGGTFKRADVYKMHAYRDAIPSARSAWILYPGTEKRFFSALDHSVYRDFSKLPALLEGVGVVPVRVGAPPTAAGELLAALLGVTARPGETIQDLRSL